MKACIDNDFAKFLYFDKETLRKNLIKNLVDLFKIFKIKLA